MSTASGPHGPPTDQKTYDDEQPVSADAPAASGADGAKDPLRVKPKSSGADAGHHGRKASSSAPQAAGEATTAGPHGPPTDY